MARPHAWMTPEEAIKRLEGWRAAAVEAAQADPEWLFDRAEGLIGDRRFRVTAFDQNCIFSHAACVAAFDIALQLMREIAERRKEPELIDSEWTPGGNQAIGL